MSSRPQKKSEMNHFLTGGMSIEKPHPHDILSGRGGASNNHMGNKIYRTVCEHNKELYATLPRNEKLPVAVRIVEAVRSRDPPGRFLERKKEDKLWYEVTEKRAVDKTAQALREKTGIVIPAGLENLGNTCYMNSVMQCLKRVDELKGSLKTFELDEAS